MIAPGDVLFAYVYVGNANVRSIMLQWVDESYDWNHRAYWGATTDNDLFAPNMRMGTLPAVGSWVRLEVPAAAVGLENKRVHGMAFTFTGTPGAEVYWDRTGTTAQMVYLDSYWNYTWPTPVDSDSDGIPDYIEDADGNGLVSGQETDWQRRPLRLISPLLR